jgi:hypothetical protein
MGDAMMASKCKSDLQDNRMDSGIAAPDLDAIFAKTLASVALIVVLLVE